MSSERQYPLAAVSWTALKPMQALSITTDDDRLIAYFPIKFIREGDVNTWRYVIQVVEMLVDRDPQFSSVIVDTEGTAMIFEEAPVPGTFMYRQPGRASTINYTRGPEDLLRCLSGPSERDFDQVNNDFRIALIARDSLCLVTEVTYEDCQAVHIVPRSRPDIYRQILGMPDDMDPYMFDVSYGLLPRRDVHHSFERLEISFFRSGEDYYLHAFRGSSMQYHGKRLPPARFHGFAEWQPDPAFMAWHYEQCVKARIRASSVELAT